MKEKELKSKIADIIMEAIEEYNSNEINRPMIASVYAGEIISFINSLPEEPVNEDLEKEGKEWLRPQLDKSYANYGEAKMMELTHFDGYAMLEAIEFGAKWKEEQLMKNAVDATVHVDAGGYPYIPQMELYDNDKDVPLAKEWDKYKVVLIKEE